MKTYSTEYTNILYISFSLSADIPQLRAASRKILKTIEDKMNVMKDALYDLEVDLLGKDVDIDCICEHLIDIGKKTEDLDFFSFTEEWVEKSDNKGKKNYLIMLNSLARYNGCRKLPFSLIDYRFLNGYKKFLDGHPRAQSLYLVYNAL